MLTLKHWGGIFFLVFGIIYLLSYFLNTIASSSVNSILKNDFFNMERFSKQTDNVHLMVIGNSLTRCAFPFDNISNKIFQKNNLKIKLNRVTHSEMKTNHFLPIIEALIKSTPDVIFIQSEYFYMNFKWQAKESIFDNYRESLKVLQSNFSSFKEKKENHYEIVKNVETRHNIRNNNSKLLAKQYKNLKIELKPYKEVSTLYRLISVLQAKKVKVILLEMGRSNLANKYLGEEREKKIATSLKMLNNNFNIDVWRFPANLSLEYYSDFAHLNLKGREVFMQWFIQKFKDNLEEL